MTARKSNGPVGLKRRHATKADIAHLTNSIDRIRDDNTRYIICMTLDLITQSIADQEETASSQMETNVTAN